MAYMAPAPARPKKEKPPREPKEKKKPRVKPEDIKHVLAPSVKRELKQKERFIITSAMNNCRVDPDVWASIETYAKHNQAGIIVVPVRYKNPTSQAETRNQDDDAWWDPIVVPYATDELVKLHEHLWVMGHVRVQATAVHPLSGLEALSNGASAIFGHSQLAMQMVAAPQNKLPKVMYTTGSCTLPIYSDTKSGVKAEFHHGAGAVVVELDGPRFHIRGVVADRDGGFFDLEYYYSPAGVKKHDGILALVTGDEHVMFADRNCKAATYTNDDSIVATLRPRTIVRHDVFDGYSISHHNRKDPVIQYSKHKEGHQSVLRELQMTAAWLDETTPDGVENVIVSSNHHDHLMQWIKQVDAFNEEPWNAEVQHELRGLIMQTTEFKDRGVVHGDPFAMWTAAHVKARTRFLGPDDSCRIGGVEVGMHGHNGTNGSRGNLLQLSKIGIRTVSGHRHTPGIIHGAYCVGTSSNLRLDYTKGPSSWAHCHCAIYPNGKRQLIFVVNGHWRN
jgi:hypothetical protein